MKKIVLTVIISFIWSHSVVHAQTIYDLVDPNFQNQALFTDKMKNVKGSVFLDDNWKNGKIIKNKQEYTFLSKYDILNQIIWIQQDEKELVLNPTSFDRIIFDYATLVSINDVLYELLEEGEFSLLVKHQKELKKASTVNDSSYGSSDYNTDELVDNDIFFIKSDAGLIEIKNKKSLEMISSNSASISKELKTNFKKKEDLIQFIKQLNR